MAESTSSNNPNKLKLLLIGDSEAGKTSLLRRYVTGSLEANANFKTSDEPGFLAYNVDVRVGDDDVVEIEVWDGKSAPGSTGPSSHIKPMQGVIIMHDVATADTFSSVEFWYDEVIRNAMEGTVVTVVGTKTDLERQTSREEAEQLCSELGIPYFETNAKTGENLNEIFIHTVKRMREFKKLLREGSFTNDAVQMSGYMTKRGAFRKSWRRRCFILTVGGQLNYYTQTRVELLPNFKQYKPRGSIDLFANGIQIKDAADCTEMLDWPRPLVERVPERASFALVTKNRTYYFVCESHHDQWRQKLADACRAT